jgi:phage baseplate assembly protein W
MATWLIGSFLGTGWGFPPEFEESTGSVRMVSGTRDIDESLDILLSTIPGERVMLPDYGCDLHRFVFHELSTTIIEEIRDTVSGAIQRWEPRIELLACDARLDPDRPGLVLIELSYRVRRSNVKGNLVYPFYTGDAVQTEES